MKSLLELHRFILDNYEEARHWDKLRFAEWLAWAKDSGYVLTVLDEQENIVGLAVAYPIMHKADCGERSDQEGPIIFVQVAVCSRKGALQSLGFAILKRFGEREKVAIQRMPFYITKVYPFKKFRRNLFRANKQLMKAS
jgi:hypothetical protein